MSYVLQRGLGLCLFVGQAPAQRDDPREPLSGRSGRRLASLMGVPLIDFMIRYDRANLIDRWPGHYGGGDAFPRRQARDGAVTMLQGLEDENRDYQGIVLLGRGVAKAFRREDQPLFEWWPFRTGLLAVIPHPSGVSRWWNKEENLYYVERWLKELDRWMNIQTGPHSRPDRSPVILPSPRSSG